MQAERRTRRPGGSRRADCRLSDARASSYPQIPLACRNGSIARGGSARGSDEAPPPVGVTRHGVGFCIVEFSRRLRYDSGIATDMDDRRSRSVEPA